MTERTESVFTLVSDHDLFENPFYCFHNRFNEHIDLTLAINRDGLRTIYLGPRQCLQWGRRFILFYHEIMASRAAQVGDYQI